MKQWTIIISFIGFFLSRPTATFSAETALKIVNVAVPAFSLSQAPRFTAPDAGAFKESGMEVRYVVTLNCVSRWKTA
jgi:hypothetical protein